VSETKVDNHDLLEALNALKIQRESLRGPVRNSPVVTREHSLQFLLAEFNALGEFWRHTDSRMEGSLNLYFTASALMVSGMAYLSQQVINAQAFVASVAAVAVTLFIGGLILSRRILRTVFLKAEYVKALNLIRRYFIDADQSIKHYLSLPCSHSPTGATEPPAQVSQPSIPASLLTAIHAWDSLLLGFACGSIAWLTEPRLLAGFLIGLGILIAAVCFIVLSIIQFQARATLESRQSPPEFTDSQREQASDG